MRLAARGALGILVLLCPAACTAAGGCAEGGGDEATCAAHSRSLLQDRFKIIQEVGRGAALEETALSQLLEEGGLGGVPMACAWFTCLNFHDMERERKCAECVAEATDGVGTAEVGVNGVTAGFVIDLLKLFGDRSTENYARHVCGDHLGNLSACRKTKDYMGTYINSHDQVAAMLGKLPAKEWSGEWWRGNEAGIIIVNPFFWSGRGIDPMSTLLGVRPKQHAVIRPILEELFTLGTFSPRRRSEVQAIVTDAIRGFLEQGRMNGLPAVKSQLLVLVHQILFQVAFGTTISSIDAQKFVMMQSKVLALGVFTQTLPAEIYGHLVPVRDRAAAYMKQFAGLLEERFGQQLGKEDCSPSESCMIQLAAAVFDALMAGREPPTALTTGIAVLLSEHGSNPFRGGSFARGEARNFFWEVLRFFPPASSFPLWEKRPTCAGLSEADTAALSRRDGETKACPLGAPDERTHFPKVNQYQGGERVVLSIALAQKDPKVWGPDADKFVVRELKEYEKSLGFAEAAVDVGVAGGGMNRVCPGKDLALMIGSTFFELFDRSHYELSNAKDAPILIGGPSWTHDFGLNPKSMAGI